MRFKKKEQKQTKNKKQNKKQTNKSIKPTNTNGKRLVR
jgi:hypothetical protein